MPVQVHDLAVQPVRRVWVESGCISCGWCGDLLPTIFTGGPDQLTTIVASARVDGCCDANSENHTPLRKPLKGDAAEFMHFVAAGCPPQVIQFE